MAVRTVDVAAVMAALGVGGCADFCGGEYEDSGDVTLTDGEFATYAGDSGVISDGTCKYLCESVGFARVDSCGEPHAEGNIPTPIGENERNLTYVVTCRGSRMHTCEGRRPPALGRLPRKNREAALEAASIHAFLRLHRELELHGAPASLRHRCLAAARDEVRHARLLSSDGRVPRVRVGRRPLRSLAAVARDNAVEGCVHETWGALVAHLDPRPVYRVIAADELRHAQLAWDIEAWLGPHARPDLRRRAGARLVARTEGPLRPWAEAMRERLWGECPIWGT